MLWAFVQWVEFVGYVSEYHLLGRWSQGGMGNGVSIPYFMSRSFQGVRSPLLFIFLPLAIGRIFYY